MGDSDQDKLRKLRARLAQLREKHQDSAPEAPKGFRTGDSRKVDSFLANSKSALLASKADDRYSELPSAHPKKAFMQHAMYTIIILALAIGLTSVNFFSDKSVVDIQGQYVQEISTCQNETDDIMKQLDSTKNQLNVVSGQLAEEIAAKESLSTSCVGVDDVAALQGQIDEKSSQIAALQEQIRSSNSAEQRQCEIDYRDVQRDANSLIEQIHGDIREACIAVVVDDHGNTTDAINAGLDAKININDYKFKLLS